METLKNQNEKLDIVFLDPPYATNYAEIASQKIAKWDLLNEDGRIIIETDREKEVVQNLEKLQQFEIYDQRKYGKVRLLFLRKK